TPYKTAVKKMDKGDFVYFDPPYPPLNGTSYFTHYTKEGFSRDDHAQLAKQAKELKEKGCYVLISNADTTYIRTLYKEQFKISELKVTRWISANGKRYKAEEIAITNYDV
ncbi:DNA adenine methylase, partial [Candidatus Pacearchaeota archaeon]|nr:DNA adenine methylase [Candidatus Pacearchaeota archaeon]